MLIRTDMEKPHKFNGYILAAGHGTRMRSSLAKPLHQVGGMAMLGWVIETAQKAGADQLCVVTSPKNDQVADYVNAGYADLMTARQEQALGTGHATQIAHQAIPQNDNPILVLFGDTPLVTAETCQRMIARIAQGEDVVVLGFEPDNPTGYGRLKCDEDGMITAIIEEADASEDDKAITLVNAGVMALSAKAASEYLSAISNDNAQKEYYLTDIVAIARADHAKVGYVIASQEEVRGVNSRNDLAEVEAILQNRLRRNLMASGVTLQAPDTVFLSGDAIIEDDVTIEPHVVIGKGCVVKTGAILKAFSHIEGAIIGKHTVIGPYARLRPGTELGDHVKIGNFVEIKKSQFEEGAKANHLSYIGDAHVGAKANIGAGTITCNYDGYDKFKTNIGKGAFIGSNTALVAPVTIGEGAIIGAGSTITKSVADDDLSLTRAPQKTLPKGGASFRARKGK